jgi:hypothetical protein
MFANPKFSGRRSPKFRNVFTGDPEREHGQNHDGLPYITAPPKTLVAIDIFDVPPDAEGSLKDVPDYITGVSLMPEDAIKLVRWLNRLICELFNDDNYAR